MIAEHRPPTAEAVGNGEDGARSGSPLVEHRGHRHHLARGTGLEHLGQRAVVAVGVAGLSGEVRVHRGHRGQRLDLSRPGIDDDHGPAVRVGLLDLLLDRTLSDPLQVAVDGQLHRRAIHRVTFTFGTGGDLTPTDPALEDLLAVLAAQLLVQAVFEPGTGLAVLPDVPEHVGAELTRGVVALRRALPEDAAQIQRRDGVPGLGSHLLGDVREVFVRRQRRDDLVLGDVQDRGQVVRCRILVGDQPGVGGDIHRFNGLGQWPHVRVVDGAALGRQGNHSGAVSHGGLRPRSAVEQLQIDQPCREDRQRERDAEGQQSQPLAGIGRRVRPGRPVTIAVEPPTRPQRGSGRCTHVCPVVGCRVPIGR